MRKIEVHHYQANWKDQFYKEAELLKNILDDEIIKIHHIGSTSVPGLAAKPIIDIIIEVKNIYAIDNYNKYMHQIGYEAFGENGLTGRRYFQKGGDTRSHHVHVYQTGNSEILRHIALRDYLIAHPEEAQAYGKLKLTLARQCNHDVESYISGKHDFVQLLEEKALKWFEKK